ncbi:CPBP family intramembrane glutamic endopeptidase [Rhizobium sp. PAMB 3182]
MQEAGRKRGEGTFGVAIAAFVLWIAVTSLTGVAPEGATDISELVSAGLARQFFFASAFILLIAWIFRWRDLGFNRPRPGLFGIIWLPALYIAVMFASAVSLGLPPPHVVALVFINTMLVGISEETMFRGVLFSGARRVMRIWPAIIVVTLVFGVVHVLNALFTGNLLAAVLQALAATMSGLLFMAVRIRSGSLYPAIALHALWDFSLLTIVRSASAQAEGLSLNEVAATIPWYQQLVPVLVVLPLLMHAVYLLRKVGRDSEIE